MRVLFLTTIPSPYRVDFFNELGKECDLCVLFENDISVNRDVSWKNFRFEHFRGLIFNKNIQSLFLFKAFEMIKHIKHNKYDKIIISNFLTASGMIVVKYLKRKKIPYYLESDGGFAKNGKGFKEKLKKYIISGANGYFSTAEEHDKYYISYGAEESKLIRYPFTSIKQSDVISSRITSDEQSFIRQKLGMSEEKIVLSVGRFTYDGGYGKGYDTLLKTSSMLPKTVGVYIVGGEPTEEFVKMKSDLAADNVHFVEFKSKKELAEYYLASDLFVLMTRGDVWGLVINEAMSFGLPVITTNKCIAGLEMVSDDRCILEPEDVEGLSKIALEILQDPLLSERISLDNLATASKYTIEAMARKHIEIFNKS